MSKKVICIDSAGCALIKGKIYFVVNETEETYFIKNSNGVRKFYQKDKFKNFTEMNSNDFNLILDQIQSDFNNLVEFWRDNLKNA